MTVPAVKHFVVAFFMSILVLQEARANDQTTCMTDYEDGEGLHYMCFCSTATMDVRQQAKEIENHPGFSLAHFAYNLAGSFFGKAVHIAFQNCRHLKLVLDHMELSRIGSDFFRPDIQVKGLGVEQVYHLELVKPPPSTKDDDLDEYLIAFPAESLEIELISVALVKLDAGAKFSKLQANSDSVRLYIDLNQGQVGEEENLNIFGFRPHNIFFVTNNRKIRLEEGENLEARMKELTLSMSSNTVEVSCALVTFALVIFVGIVGLFVVVIHRQKRKRQLKALLRAKNLGPILESKAIAQSTGMKYYPKYTVNPDIEALPEPGAASEKKLRRLDINDLLAGIMIRVRNAPETKDSTPRSNEVHNREKSCETSFYYKESSLSSNNEEVAASTASIKDVAVQVHQNATIDEDSLSEEGNSYVSKISQQVFVKKPTTKSNMIKNKFASFFSSVSLYSSGSLHRKNDTKL